MACRHPGGVNYRTLLGAGLVLQASYAGVPEKPQDRQQEMGVGERFVRLHLGQASCCRNCWNNRGAKRMSGGHKGCTMQPPGNSSGLSRKLLPRRARHSAGTFNSCTCYRNTDELPCQRSSSCCPDPLSAPLPAILAPFLGHPWGSS